MKLKKKTKKKIIRFLIVFIISLLSISVIVLSVFAYYTIPKLNRIDTYKADDKFFWADFFYLNESLSFKDSAHGILLSDKVSDLMESAKILKGISSSKKYDFVFLIAESQVKSPISDVYVCKKCKFYGADGRIDVDKEFLQDFSKSEIISANDKIFMNDSSVNYYLPLINNYFSDSKIVPILVSKDAKEDNLIRIKNYIKSKASNNSLFISTLSFSEETDLSLKEIDDATSLRTIYNFDFDNIPYLDVSNKDSLRLFLSLMDIFANKKIEKLEKNLLFFKEENIDLQSGTTMVLFGNVFDDFEHLVVQNYKYDENKSIKNDNSDFRLFRDIRGNKDSFLVGPDYLVFDGINGECIKLSRNLYKTSVCKFIEGDKNATSIIKEEKQERDFVVTIIEYTQKTLSDDTKKFVKEIAEAGSDVVLGKGLSENVPAEKINNSLVLYSLGDFLPNAKLLSELTSNLKGSIALINVDRDSLKFYILPISIISGYPQLIGSEILNKNFNTILFSPR